MNIIGDATEGLVKGIGGILDDLFTSDEERAKAAIAMRKIADAPFIASMRVLEKEASHKSIFVAGARPALLWGCVAGIAYEGILRGMLQWLINVSLLFMQNPPDIPPLPSIEGVFFELCSLAAVLYGARGIEKVKGVATNALNVGSPKPTP